MQPLSRDRKRLLHFLANLAKELCMSTIPLYTAVNYFDRIVSGRNYSENFKVILSVACLFVASKVEEDPAFPPKISQILSTAQLPIGRKQIIECELFILFRLGWTLRVSTVLHHANRLHSIGMFSDVDGIDGIPLTGNHAAVQRITDCVRYFCDLLLLDRCVVSYLALSFPMQYILIQFSSLTCSGRNPLPPLPLGPRRAK